VTGFNSRTLWQSNQVLRQVHSAKRIYITVSTVDNSEPRQMFHSGRGYWISGPAG